MSKNLSVKFNLGILATREKSIDHAKQSFTDVIKLQKNNSKCSISNW